MMMGFWGMAAVLAGCDPSREAIDAGAVSADPALGQSDAGSTSNGAPATPDGSSHSDGGLLTPLVSNAKTGCVISADCPAGEHCDLGECVQECNVASPCSAGLVCSPRARCLQSDTLDKDPAPQATHAGDLVVDPTNAFLTEHDTALAVTLKSSSKTAVRYRVQLDAPHLTISSTRGQFVGQTNLSLPIVTSGLKGRDVSGSVKIFTTLGNAVVSAPMHIGVTGTYRGTLRYDGGIVPMGDTGFEVGIIENNGDVIARVDSRRSMLFPAADGTDTTGRGNFAVSSGLDFTLNQRLTAVLGGTRNHFGREIGRRLHITAKPASSRGGDLDGTFTETVYGLFSQPITMTGAVLLDYQQMDADPEFNLGIDPAMPSSPSKTAFLALADVAGWGKEQSTQPCREIVCGSTGCSTADARAATIAEFEETYYQPLLDNMPGKTSEPLLTVANACRKAAGLPKTEWEGDLVVAHKCSYSPMLGCALALTAEQSTADTINTRLFDRLFKETAAASLLVAKDEVVQALYDSFALGSDEESKRYDNAMAALDPVATWVMQPAIIEHMRSMVPAEPYTSARTLADLLQTISTIDGERSRVRLAARASTDTNPVTTAQQRALLTFLEATTLSEVLRSWGSAPPAIAAGLSGVLTPLDRGFKALLQGANAFGIPAGFVPFIYSPDNVAAGATNFGQMLTDAKRAVDGEKTLQDAFKDNKRTYEQNTTQLQDKLAQIRMHFDARLKSICGNAFDPEQVHDESDWSTCGGGGTGDVADLRNQVDLAMARLRSAESQIQGMKDKIAIDKRTLAETQKVHADTLTFIDATGKELESITFSESVINAAEKLLDGAAAAVGSFGVSGVTSLAQATLEVARGGLEVQRQHLQTAQQMRFEQAGAAIELINGMANIQKETIDLTQLGVDIHQEAIAVLGAQLRVGNAIAEAHSALDERGRALALVQGDPANDPTFRILRDQEGLDLLAARAHAQQRLYLAGRALEYEINTPLSTIEGAVLKAANNQQLSTLASCLETIFTEWGLSFGTPQTYSMTVSIRKMLGITGPRTDDVTGEQLSEGEQFRRYLLRNENLDGAGGVGISFSTNLQPGNGLWTTDVCADRIASVQAQLVGDFLGDNEAQVNIAISGDAVMRSCDSESLTSWAFGSTDSIAARSLAVVGAGVNSFGDSPANTSLYGQSVARAAWQILVPGPAAAPSNADVDIRKIDDIVLKFQHRALPHRRSGDRIDISCLGG
jgi:hypothetical protein